jgi:hypothetical protein
MSRITEASQRLVQSRAGLRRALRDQTHASDSNRGSLGQNDVLALLTGMRDMPGADVIVQALKTWWMQHPLRAASAIAWDSAKAALQPVVKRHPVALMAAAVAVGGVLAMTRPWRWVFKPALFAAVLPQILSSILAAQPPPPPPTP